MSSKDKIIGDLKLSALERLGIKKLLRDIDLVAAEDLHDLELLLALVFLDIRNGNISTSLHDIKINPPSLKSNEDLPWLQELSGRINRLEKKFPLLRKSYPGLIADSSDKNTALIYLAEQESIYLRSSWKAENLLLNNLEMLLKESEWNFNIGQEELDYAYSSLAREPGISPEQRHLLKNVLSKRLNILSGGPGTGKTSSIVVLFRSIFYALKENAATYKIELAAPTGRAANRILESIRLESQKHPCAVDKYLPTSSNTVHKLLGLGSGGRVQRNKDRPLIANLIVIDEASMIDIHLMNHLLSAVSLGTGILLIGDPAQLPAVEQGALLLDFLQEVEFKEHLLHENVVQLKRSFRSNKLILNLAEAIIASDAEQIAQALQEAPSPDIIKLEPLPNSAQLTRQIVKEYKLNGRYEPYASFAAKPEDWMKFQTEIDGYFTRFDEFAVLSPLRKGLLGVELLNQNIDKSIANGRPNYHGRPIVITQNNYDLNLFNGDRAVIFSFSGFFYAFFKEQDSSYRFIPISRLFNYESAFVQTIHRSQGSEFDHVIILLPEGSSQFIYCENLYTAVTRAKNKLTIIGELEELQACARTKVRRNSGIKKFLLPKKPSLKDRKIVQQELF